MRFWRALREKAGDAFVSAAYKLAFYGQIFEFIASYEGLVEAFKNKLHRIVRLDWRRNGQLTYQEVSDAFGDIKVLPDNRHAPVEYV